MAEISEKVEAQRSIGLSVGNVGWWLRLAASLVLIAWFTAVVWGMLGSFDLWNLSSKLLDFAPSGALSRIFMLPHWDVLLAHMLLLLAAMWLTGLVVALGVGSGRLLGLGFGDEPALLGIGMAAALGYALVCLIFTLLTLAGWLYDWLVWTLTIAATVGTLLWLAQRRLLIPWARRHALGTTLRSTLGEVRHPVRNFVPFVLLLATILSAIFALATALAPPVLYDTMLYHLALPRQYVSHHGFVPVYSETVILFAEGMEFIYTWPLTLFGGGNWAAGSIAGVMHWAMGILTAAGAYGFCRSLGLSGRAGLLAAAAFLTQPLVNREIGTAYVDVGNAFFTLFCLYALYRWWRTERGGWLTAAALLAGTAAAVKVFGAPLIVLTIALVIAKWWRKRTPLPNPPLRSGRENDHNPPPIWESENDPIAPDSEDAERVPGCDKSRPYDTDFVAAQFTAPNSKLKTQNSKLSALRLAAVAGLIGVLTACYSYIASWIVLGNPLWPELNGIFHGWNSPTGDANYKQLVSYLFSSVDQGPMTFSAGGMGKYLFWNLWLDQASPLRGGFTVPRLVPVTTALLPVALLLGGWAVVKMVRGRQSDVEGEDEHKVDLALWWGFGYALVFTIVWFLLQGQRRYILFTLPLVAAGLGWVYERLRARLPLAGLGFSLFLVVTLYVATLSNLAFNFRAFSNVYGRIDDNFYILEGATIRLGEGGQTMLYLNHNAPPAQTVLITELTAPLYYLGRDYVMSNPGWDDFLSYATLKTADDFKQRLDHYNASYLVDTRDRAYLDPLMQQGMWRGRNLYMHMVYTQGNWYTYQRNASPPASGLKLGTQAGRIGMVGFGGGVPPDLRAVNLDGLDRLKLDTLRGLDTIVVKRGVPRIVHTNLDVYAVYAPDAATIDQRLAQNATLVGSVGDYNVYRVDGVDLPAVFGLQHLPIKPSNWQMTLDESNAATVSQSDVLSVTLPLTGTVQNSQTLLDVDRQGVPLPGLSAIMQSNLPPTDLNGASVLLVDLQVSSGAMVRVSADLDGQPAGLVWRFNGSGDGVDDEMVIYIPPGAHRIANLNLALSGPQGGTGNLVGGKLIHDGGQAQVRMVVRSISLFKLQVVNVGAGGGPPCRPPTMPIATANVRVGANRIRP